MPTITINPELCQRDGLCALICQKVFSQGAKGALPRVAHEESCNSCGHCVMLCPSGAISQVDCPPENVHSVRSELMPTYEQVREMLLARRSIRNFQQKSVDEEIIERVIEGARFAPSAKNTQSTRFIVIRDQAMLHAIASLTAGWLGKVSVRLKNPVWRMLYLLAGATDAGEIMRWVGQFELIAKKMEQNTDLVLFGAPVLLLFHGDRTIRFAEANANLALQNATMISFSLGLGSFYTGYVVTACNHGRAIPRLIGLPKGHMVYGGLALGYPKIGFSKWIERNPAPVRWI
jgi:nitroreductase/NAD-dependent dihydropyrimidine dehydrogenase PreA subunit